MPHVAECFSVLRPCVWEHKTEFQLNPQCFVEVASYVLHPVYIAGRSLKFPGGIKQEILASAIPQHLNKVHLLMKLTQRDQKTRTAAIWTL